MTIAALSGSRIELVLRSDRFIFRPLELPNRANEFMPGIVRSQIDRLTPWNPADAAFGWSKPVEVGGEKMIVTIAATPLCFDQAIHPGNCGYWRQFDFRFHRRRQKPIPTKVPSKSGSKPAETRKDIGRIRQTLVMVLAAACITGGIAIGADAIMGMNLTAQQDELARQISGCSVCGRSRYNDSRSARARAAKA